MPVLQKKLEIDNDLLSEIIDEIVALNPRPGEGKISIGTETVIPDLLAVQRDGIWKVLVNDSWIPDLKLSNEYVTMLGQKDLSRDTQKYLKDKFDSASWFIQSIQQRRQTLTAVMQTIIEKQQSFFEFLSHLRLYENRIFLQCLPV